MGAGMRKELVARILRGAQSATDMHHKLLSAFQEFDADGNGVISYRELEFVMQQIAPNLNVRRILDETDLNHDGFINFEEMVDWLTSSSASPAFFARIEQIMEAVLDEAVKLRAEEREVAAQAETQPSLSGWKDKVEHFRRQRIGLTNKLHRQYESELTPIIQDMVGEYDFDQNGVLDRDESILFFSDFISRSERHYLNMVKLATKFTGKDAKKAEEMQARAEKAAKEKLAKVFADLDKHIEAAFKVIDSNHNYNLEVSELVEALIPGRKNHKAFLGALGISIPELEPQHIWMQD
eukprot:TRINITY_DN8972_c0_g2_i1.p1 TRINITY_DN8972_c0_g2~~TRINITY_DN8972_c0_g2_i1.p1  ORF type:complete len:295 (-),score=80.05 TRINITY_DN8972_c0_g2_i1:34-918(-)